MYEDNCPLSLGRPQGLFRVCSKGETQERAPAHLQTLRVLRVVPVLAQVLALAAQVQVYQCIEPCTRYDTPIHLQRAVQSTESEGEAQSFSEPCPERERNKEEKNRGSGESVWVGPVEYRWWLDEDHIMMRGLIEITTDAKEKGIRSKIGEAVRVKFPMVGDDDFNFWKPTDASWPNQWIVDHLTLSSWRH